MKAKPTLQRLMESIQPVEDCWIWQKRLSSRGNPSISMKVGDRSSPCQATRVIWKEKFGVIPDKNIIRQKCGNKLCINPDHLILSTKSELVVGQFKNGRVAWNLGVFKEQCINGHNDWSKVLPGGGRKCLTCSREHGRQHSASRKRFLDSVKLTTGCIDCGFDNNPAALDFDHLNRFEKNGNVSMMRVFSWDKLLSEIMKCVIRCSNCHRIKTAECKEYQ